MNYITRIIAGIALAITLSTSAIANDCEAFGKVATSTMQARQNGVPIQKIVETAKKHFQQEELLKIVLFIIKEAYSKPRFMSEDNQEMAITEFGNEVYLGCLNATGTEI